MRAGRILNAPTEEQELSEIRNGNMALQALGFVRAVQQEEEQIILGRAKNEYRAGKLTLERALCYIAELTALEATRLRLENLVQAGNIAAERRENRGNKRS